MTIGAINQVANQVANPYVVWLLCIGPGAPPSFSHLSIAGARGGRTFKKSTMHNIWWR
jgi:hypothetical protein